MDTELFMECEEEELEPWQQVDDSVEEDDVDFMDMYGEPVEDSSSPPPPFETPSSRTPPPITPALTASSPPAQLSSSSSSVPPCPPTVSVSTCGGLAPPLMAQASPLILTQTAGGTFLLPAAPGTGNRQPILLTTQGFPVQTVMNPSGQLVLNLQPGQTVQPLTLFQSSSGLGQLVRHGVGVSPVLQQGHAIQTNPATAGGSAFSAVQLPTTLTIRTTTPKAVNLQVTRVGGANALKLAGSPALPSGSANGVARVTAFSSSTSTKMSVPSVVMTPSVTAGSSQVVMSVEEFFYGTFEGDKSRRKPPLPGLHASTFTCQTCSHLAENNLRLMEHMLLHSELVNGGSGEKKCCRYCYRQFWSTGQLQNHQEQVHGPAYSSSICRICEWAFENEPAFLDHMKTNHRPGEMPYICQVCSYRSSFYSNMLQHFASFHRDSRYLLCVFCLKVTRNPVTYQQHLLRHQTSQAFHCNRCRLQFVLLKEKMQHKLEHHRSFRRPPQLEGLPPGSKVTIRTYGKPRPTPAGGQQLLQAPSPLIQPINIKTEGLRSPVHKVSRSPRSQNKKPVNRRLHVSRRGADDHLMCLECGTDASDFSAHYPTHVQCLLCPYSSCCSRAYAAHMIHHHVAPNKDKDLPLHELPPPCVYLLRCSRCDFRPQTADQMAEHLLFNPLHHSATCCRKVFVERDIQFSPNEQLRTQKDPGPDQNQNQDSADLSWRSAGAWKEPTGDATPTVVPFRHLRGPRHNLSKSSDAIDFFNLLFPAALVELITAETNAHGKTCQFLGWSPQTWVPVTTHEIKGFIGLVILMGIQNLPNPANYWSWSHYDNSYTFYRAMSFKRFNQIAANIRMGSFTTDEHRGTANAADSLHIFRPMLDILGDAMGSAYQPNCCLTIDRTLLPRLDEESGSAKAAPRTQPQVWLLCDSKSGYCHRLYIQWEAGGRDLGFTVVPELLKGLEDKYHQLYLSSALTSVPLLQKLLDQGAYASSSFPPPNPILPQALWDEGRLDKPGDFLQRRFGPLLATRWRDTKEMGCLSSNAAPGQTDTVWRRSQSKLGELDPVARPMAFRLLQENMRGVDICKQLLACNPLGGVPQDRHWRSLFWFLINLSIVNAFIVLRESRKDNPPAWVQDGLFSQVNFRKRLGNQLAKCAQKYFETMEIAGSRRIKAEDGGPPKERHRLAKISNLPKRCRVCNLKNVRHESVHGCVVCKVSLCKQPGCFWEHHGLPPHHQGSTKVGFLRDHFSGAVEADESMDGLDHSMAPVEDLDSSDDERLEDQEDVEGTEVLQEEPLEQENQETSHHPKSKPPTRPKTSPRQREDLLSARQLRIALFALCNGLRSASRLFSTEVQLIRSWLKEARRHLKRAGPEREVDGVAQMTAWVLSMREQQLPITESDLFHQASTLKKKGSFSDSFRISYDWAVSFLLQNRLGTRSVGRAPTLARVLPPSLEDNVRSFREFTQKVFQVHQLTEDAVLAMDELCLFVDLALVRDRSRRSEALQVTGTAPLLTVYLTVRADGATLPALVLTTRPLSGTAPEGPVLLEVCPESAPVEEALDLWSKKVWLQHLSARTQPRKSMLVLDRHREHVRDQFLASVSSSGTLPAVIPSGCSFCLQPLEVCVKPVLQRHLLTRWVKFSAGDPEELEEADPQHLYSNVAQVLVDWLVEALIHINKLPGLWKKSFDLTRLLPRPEEENQEAQELGRQKLEEVQSDLMENLLGPDASDVPDLLELEDEDNTDEEQHGGEGPEDQKEAEHKEKEAKEDSLKMEEKEGLKDKGESSEEEKEVEEDREEVSKERRETRIVIGEEVGDEWKITVKSRSEGVAEEKEES